MGSPGRDWRASLGVVGSGVGIVSRVSPVGSVGWVSRVWGVAVVSPWVNLVGESLGIVGSGVGWVGCVWGVAVVSPWVNLVGVCLGVVGSGVGRVCGIWRVTVVSSWENLDGMALGIMSFQNYLKKWSNIFLKK